MMAVQSLAREASSMDGDPSHPMEDLDDRHFSKELIVDFAESIEPAYLIKCRTEEEVAHVVGVVVEVVRPAL